MYVSQHCEPLAHRFALIALWLGVTKGLGGQQYSRLHSYLNILRTPNSVQDILLV
jgi:hypothetical protein